LEKAEKDQKLIFMIPQDLLQKVDDYRFQNRIPSRAEAIRQLLEKALKELQKK
jgi:metal-responsive CopG/Arc/MetJ family transcriptional regulator